MTTSRKASPAPHPSESAEQLGAASAPRSRLPWPVQVLIAPVLLYAASSAPLLFAFVPGIEKLESPQTPIALAVAVTLGLYALTLLVAVVGVAVVARLDGGRRLRDLGWRWDRRSLPALGLGIGISAVVVAGIGVPLTGTGGLRPMDAGIAGEPVWAVLVIGLARGFVLQAIPEELIFRGYMMTSLRLRPVRAVLVSGLAFGALHLTSSGGQQGWGERVMYLAMPIGFGLAAGALMLSTRSLWAAIGVHGGLHLTLLGFALLDTTGSSIALGNGPALWLLTGLVWTLIAAALLARLVRRGTAAFQQAQGAAGLAQHGGVDEAPVGQHAGAGGRVHPFDDLAGPSYLVLGGPEDVGDHAELPGMDGGPPPEAEATALDAAPAETVEVGDVGVHRHGRRG